MCSSDLVVGQRRRLESALRRARLVLAWVARPPRRVPLHGDPSLDRIVDLRETAGTTRWPRASSRRSRPNWFPSRVTPPEMRLAPRSTSTSTASTTCGGGTPTTATGAPSSSNWHDKLRGLRHRSTVHQIGARSHPSAAKRAHTASSTSSSLTMPMGVIVTTHADAGQRRCAREATTSGLRSARPSRNHRADVEQGAARARRG